MIATLFPDCHKKSGRIVIVMKTPIEIRFETTAAFVIHRQCFALRGCGPPLAYGDYSVFDLFDEYPDLTDTPFYPCDYICEAFACVHIFSYCKGTKNISKYNVRRPYSLCR